LWYLPYRLLVIHSIAYTAAPQLSLTGTDDGVACLQKQRLMFAAKATAV
jgi:hypothetical protein